MTSGTPSGASGAGRKTFLYGLAAAAAVVGAINCDNVITDLHGMAHLSPLAPVIWEGSSWITFLAFLWVPWLAFRLAPPMRWGWRLLLHAPGVLLFSLCHVGGFILLRDIAYHLAGGHYRYGPFLPGFLYEFSKDILGYVLLIGLFWVIGAHLARLAVKPAPARPASFTIRDGARLIRVPLADILAVTAAGNYVEFALADGRRPLMRMALSALEAELGPSGFVRTHRSWLVNAERVSGLIRQGSGDRILEVAGLAVPLSRRFPGALAALGIGSRPGLAPPPAG